MNAVPSRGVPGWFWGAAILATGAVVAALLILDRRAEPSAALKYEIGPFARGEGVPVLFQEVANFAPGIAGIRALAVAPDNHIYVTGENAVLVFDDTGTEVKRFPVQGTPNALAVSPQGTVVLAMSGHLEFVGPDGAVQGKTESLGGKAYLTSVVAGADACYAADAGNRIVLRFDYSGNLLARIGREDPARDIPGFIVPGPHLDLAFDPDGGLWAANPGRLGLEQYRPDGSLVASWYRPSLEVEGFCGCCNPTHIAFRPDGSLITAEKGIARAKLYSADWRFLGLAAGPDAFEGYETRAASGESDVAVILDVAVDQKGRVLILDGAQRAVRLFEQTYLGPSASLPASTPFTGTIK